MKKIVKKTLCVVVAVLLTGGYLYNMKTIKEILTLKGGEPNTK